MEVPSLLATSSPVLLANPRDCSASLSSTPKSSFITGRVFTPRAEVQAEHQRGSALQLMPSATCQPTKSEHIPTPHMEISSRWLTDLGSRQDTTELLEGNTD